MGNDLTTAPPYISADMISTTFEIPGCTIQRSLGLVRGITVRSRSIVGNFVASLQILVGGNITVYTELCEHARRDALDICLRHAAALGANAVVGVRYDANEIAAGVTEVLAYGTAVAVTRTA
ncbi:MAG TPA: YbjQ family protein [Polyangia bacterium]|nr:YbjQ family protein [Polyangia bacterium]